MSLCIRENKQVVGETESASLSNCISTAETLGVVPLPRYPGIH